MTRIFGISLLAGLLAVAPVYEVHAEGPAPFPEFSAKRVKPPTAGNTKRITIQIDPADEVRPSAAAAPQQSAQAAPQTPAGSYGWFWDKISPAAAQAGPGRL